MLILLLLLALIGTAYLKATLSHRVSSSQFYDDAAISMQLEGVSDAVTGTIVDDLNDDWGNLRGDARGNGQLYYQAYRGPFSTSLNYNVGDIVSCPVLPSPYPSGFPSFFVCIQNVTGGAAQTTPSIAPASSYWRSTTHVPVTSPFVQTWLADRIPTLANGPLGLAPAWPNISQQAAQPTASTTDPKTPSVYPTSVLGLPFESPNGTALPMIIPGGAYLNLQPTFTPAGNTRTGQTVNVPAFCIEGEPPTQKYIGGDADGDGIADCLLSRVPGMSVGGLTWYVGIRIIDNNSAINVNTAWSRDNEFQFGNGAASIPNYYGLFQTGVGLQELISSAHTGDDVSDNNSNLLNYRFGGAVPTAGTAYDETGVFPSANPLQARGDFTFVTQTDELYHQLIRRLANPGYVTGTSLAQSLSWSDSAALASRFCLVDENTILSGNPSSLVEDLLPLSTFRGAQASANPHFNSTPYGMHGSDADVAQWYLDNFNFDGSSIDTAASGQSNSYGGVFPLRPYLTARNPVSNYVTPVYDAGNMGEPISTQMLPWGASSTSTHFRGQWSQNPTPAYQSNDIVLSKADGFTYIWTDSNPSTPTTNKFEPSIYNLLNANPPIYGQWQLQPWNPNPTKANINTATFRELFRDFWCVMAGNSIAGTKGNSFNATPFGQTPAETSIYKSDPGVNPQCMFRSPLRDCTSNVGSSMVTQLDSPMEPGVNTMQLRAALAAVNAMGLRSGSQDVISRTIALKNVQVSPGPNQPLAAQTVQARVYSSEPQPFITEVYANTYADSNDPSGGGLPNLKGYVAIELYNPYSVPLTLNNWVAGYIPRTAATYPNLTFDAPGTITSIGPLIPMSPPSNAAPNTLTVVIPAHGYALLENFNSNFTPAPSFLTLNQPNVNDAHYRPSSMFYPQTYWWTARTGLWPGPSPATAANPSVVEVYVPGLSNVIADLPGTPNPSTGGEFVLLRPRRADGIFTKSGPGIAPATSTNPQGESYDEGSLGSPNLADLVPVDSYDFTGLQQSGQLSPTYNVLSYVRPKGMPAGASGSNFRSTYPGPYNGIVSLPAMREYWSDAELNLPAAIPQMSVQWTRFLNDQFQPFQPVFGIYFSGLYDLNSKPARGSLFAPIQLFNLGVGKVSTQAYHFPNSAVSQPGNSSPTPQQMDFSPPLPQQFPFGTFARNGDILEVPYIGAYRITLASQLGNTSTTQQFLELNSLPMDSAMAAITGTDPTSDAAIEPYENVGRFIPLSNNPGFQGSVDYFSWTRNLFNYFTVQSTNDNYFPNVDPALYDTTLPPHVSANNQTNPGFVYPPSTTPPPSGPVTAPNVTQTHNADAAATTELAQDNVGVDGLININTASYQVLSQLPLVPVQSGSKSNTTLDQNLAKAIVNWRNQHGPFMSIEDLNGVLDSNNSNVFQNGEQTLTLSNLTSQAGILTPPDPSSKFPDISSPPLSRSIAEDFQADNAALSRISNMITTRSDTFTVYIELQGWSNAGTTGAFPVMTRRYAFIADRSAINADPRTRIVKTIVVPNN